MIRYEVWGRSPAAPSEVWAIAQNPKAPQVRPHRSKRPKDATCYANVFNALTRASMSSGELYNASVGRTVLS